jgi:hypothetical protein
VAWKDQALVAIDQRRYLVLFNAPVKVQRFLESVVIDLQRFLEHCQALALRCQVLDREHYPEHYPEVVSGLVWVRIALASVEVSLVSVVIGLSRYLE